jgi:hypothetical protein
MMLIKALGALKAGEQLVHSETWKTRQILGNALTTLLVFAVMFIPEKYGISADMVPGVVTGIVSFASVVNMYLTKATTTKALPTNPFKRSGAVIENESAANDKLESSGADLEPTEELVGDLQTESQDTDDTELPVDWRSMQDKAVAAITSISSH